MQNAVDHRSRSSSRRGVTLVEMLVTVAMLVLMMTVLVQVFQAATGALNSAQSFQELDNSLRRLDVQVRSDLDGVTARLTPPLDPKNNLGYFEYGENAFADLQGEDSDDYLRFTAKAPPGRPFRGRVFLKPPFDVATGKLLDPADMSAAQLSLYKNSQPITITSECAEIIYFVRNGNLYRRVLLIAPERQDSIVPMFRNTWPAAASQFTNDFQFQPGAFGGSAIVSWQGVNDLSARPAKRGSGITPGAAARQIVLNTLGDLTNRENRFAAPRFADDYNNDGVSDDGNADGVPDFYPTLYADATGSFTTAVGNLISAKNGYVASLPTGVNYFSAMAFPYIFPGAYSQPETDVANLGWIHSPVPDQTTNIVSAGAASALLYLQRLNHNPLDVGDNLYRPESGNNTFQTWWGFPTSRETLSLGWQDPTVPPNFNAGDQANGLSPRNPSNASGGVLRVADDANLLPPMTSDIRTNPQLFTDGMGTSSAVYSNMSAFWANVWEDDLIMTGVRSFDVKVLDDVYGGYVDLGWADDVRLTGSETFLAATPPLLTWGVSTVNSFTTFGHEGRMPPLVADNRYDAQFGQNTYRSSGVYTGNIGDDSGQVNRLRRVFDTWSTDYTNAPAHAIDPSTGLRVGPPNDPPVYPSYPPPYPAPLKGIQIQVRAVDPSNQHVKQITIRHDFTDKL
ncbi:PulJ/GspJ family protein [Paludisphaera mucosa]|uniref:Type II secretion system protein n=1 Tax=Paludisphaera mucosa TaxID=3030827 RepID=A0ABT6F7E4_9BACT|nr:type II secretion system protein [Paludisphaera mucosa]MDG3003328.1 type II secretion system protein [Paludisphaera mucosa]